MPLEIPDRLHGIIIDLLSHTDELKMSIPDELSKVEPGSYFDAYEQKMQEAFPDEDDEWRTQVLRLVFSLTSLADSDSAKGSKAIAEDFIETVKEFPNLEEPTKKSLIGLRKFAKAIIDSHDTIGLGAKAAKLMLQHERVFIHSDIYSDVRHIFPAQGPSKAPIGAVVHHVLKLHIHHDYNQHKDIYMTLDYDDLKKMKHVIERAMEKHVRLSETVQKNGIHFIEPGGTG